MLASITDAMNVLSDTNSDQETINRATSVLEGAKTIFEEAKQKGTKNEDLIVSEIKIEPEESVMTTSKTTKTMPYSIIEESKLQLTAKIRPENAENQKLIWSSSNPNVATVDENGLVTALTYGKAVITATLEGESGLSASCTIQTRYNDVADKGKYWFNPVYWAADKGITKGYANIFFGPEENCTREQLITFLYREAGKPSVSSSDIKEYNTFSDVDAGAYYEKAVVWAAKNGITKGYSKGPYAGKFGVGLNITREDTVTFLYRMAKTVAGNEFDDVTDLDFHNKSYEFKDVAKGMYYQKAIVWAAKNSITKGYSNGENAGKFGVGFNVVRGDIVTFLYRYDRKYN